MEARLTPDQEEHLARLASRNGTNSEELAPDAVLRLLDDDDDFRATVCRGLEQADRGELLSHEEVRNRMERLLRP